MKSPVLAWMRPRMWLSVRPGRDRDALERIVGLRLVDEHDARRAHRELVAIGQVMIADALAAQERAVERAQVAQQEPTIRGALNLRVLLRDDAIQDLDRVVGMTTDRIEGGELELLPLFPRNDDQLGHRELERIALIDGTEAPQPSKARRGDNSLPLHGKSVAFWPPAGRFGTCDSAGQLWHLSARNRDRGGIGRRAGLRCQWVTPWGFESLDRTKAAG